MTRFEPESIRKISGLSIQDKMYKVLCSIGYYVDPLSNWFPLVQLKDIDKINRLRKKALLAQEYYKLSKMVGYFIYDLTKEEMPDPDDIVDEQKGKWKSDLYGEPFDYQNRQTQMKILDNYLIDRPYRVALIYEGETEDTVVRMIFDALYIDQKRDGILLYNAKGQGNIEKNLYGLAELAKANEMRIFLIVDRDGNWRKIIDNFKERGYINDVLYYVWKKDFETDNFTIDEVVDAVNFALEKKYLQEIEKDQVEQRINTYKVGITKAISDLIWKSNKTSLENVISKRELGSVLIESRIAEIRMEKDSNGWKPHLPIEKILYKIFTNIPRVLG